MALKDHKGSSVPAISKWITAKYPTTVGPYLKTRLSQAFKSGVQKGRFVKLRASYKISPQLRVQEKRKREAEAKRKKTARAAAAAAAAQKPKTPTSVPELKSRSDQKPSQHKALSSPSQEDIAKAERNKARREQARRKKEEAERKAKERAELLRKRRYPMEDTKLHAEDAQWSISNDVPPRPALPYIWQIPCAGTKLSQAHFAASKVDHLDFGSHGLVPDLLQVYHFWRGDVQILADAVDEQLVPEFTLQHLLFATNDILLGHCKRAHMLPPLITHLFCVSLSVLLNINVDQPDFSPARRKLFQDLHKYLHPILTPASWPDVCSLYMDAMQRFYSTEASDDNVLPSLNTDMKYLVGRTESPVVPMTPAVHLDKKHNNSANAKASHTEGDPSSRPLPEFYVAYLGNPHCALHRAYFKICKMDPWMLSAEELMALLSALVNDILGNHTGISENIAKRDEELYVLTKNKRLAESNFRKARLAFEGPKKQPTKKADDDKDEKEKNGNSKSESKEGETTKPTISKKQFETAKKAYEKGIDKLVARTQPLGYDRNFNAVYFFRHDPEVLYVEEVRPPASIASHLPEDIQFRRSSWHVIQTTSLFDALVRSLDVRGKREQDLRDELTGPAGAEQSLRRFLDDDVKRKAEAVSIRKEKEALKEKLKQARLKCDEEVGRRSGRLTGQAEEELSRVEEEIRLIEQRMNNQAAPSQVDDKELTGLDLMRKFDSVGRIETRRSQKKKETSKNRTSFQCSNLVGTGNIDGTGIVGMIVADLLELEELCETLVPWEVANRKLWISKLEGAVSTWNSVCKPAESSRKSLSNDMPPKRESIDSSSSAQKRQRLDTSVATPTSNTVTSVLASLKQPILDLEERIAEMTNLQVATRDQELADDNMSVDSSGEDEARRERSEKQWKKLVHRIRCTSTRRHVQIRDMLVETLAAARKAHLPQVVADLRSALLQYHPHSATDCKAAAIKVLEAYGDYEEDDDDADVENEEDEDQVVETSETEQLPSLIAAEAVVIASSFGGPSEDASRNDWIRALNATKNFARLASLTTGLTRAATEKLLKVKEEQDDLKEALIKWEKDLERQAKKAVGRPFKPYEGPSEVWANVTITNEICMVKTEKYPWWPAKKCIARDTSLAEQLSKLDRILVSLFGEFGGLRVVKDNHLKPFTGAAIDDDSLAETKKETRTQLDDCLAMARRIQRGLKKK